MTTLVESLASMLWNALSDFSTLFTAEMVLSALLGVLISLPITLYFARRSSKELREETAELQRLNTILIFGIESQGKFEVEINSEGQIVTVNRIQSNETIPAITGDIDLSSSKPNGS